ncbi:DNA mismatch repair protein MutT [Bacillus cereus]|uniref:NUDIX hydrolase n=1 Tax=Bacillus cereus TaxID=1396 RepID=UPI000BF5FFB5|nr:NUDIX hydrolase [Bacillus cereus]PFX72031.1 DNA mismatch repair protein MutT [Bacillus cereus]
MNFLLSRKKQKFNYRVAAICIKDKKILLQKSSADDYWYLPGGRVEILETGEHAIKRILKRELEINIKVKRLVWLNENLFTLNGINFHEIGFYYDVYPQFDPCKGNNLVITNECGLTFVTQWFSLKELDSLNVKPAFLKNKLKNIPNDIEHIVV